MRITTTTNNLLEAFARISKIATASEREKQVTGGLVCIKASGTDIYVIASTSRTSVRVPVTGFVLEEGEVTANFKSIAEYIHCVSEENITLCTKKGALIISTKGAQAEFPTPENKKLPDIPQIEGEKMTVFVKADEFEKAIKATSFATESDAEGVLKGLNVIITPKGGMITAMSNHRIAIRKFSVGDGFAESINIIIPKCTIEELEKVFAGSSSVLRIESSKNAFLVTAENSCFYGTLIEGKFYDFKRMFAVDTKTIIEVDRKSFIDYLVRLSVFCTGDIPLVLDVENGKVVSKISSSKGTSSEEIPATIKGENIKIGVNPVLLMEHIKNSDGEKVALRLHSEKSPIIAMGANYSFLILPISISKKNKKG